MSYPPPGGQPPPYYPPPPPNAPGAFAYVPAPVVMPMYPPPPPMQRPPDPPAPTYITNHIYQETPQPAPAPAPPPDPPKFVEHVDPVSWVPSSANDAHRLRHKALVAGKEGWDNSPLWVIRAHHSGELVPGKFASKHRAGYIPHAGTEVPVHNFEVLCCPAHSVQWVRSNNGLVPPGAIPAGNTHNAEPLYIARVAHMRSITPGKVHPSHGCAYISFSGSEVAFKNYEVLCNIVG